MLEITFETMAALAAVATLAGFIDAIAGGGGLITLPALFLAGIDPVAAIATNKLQAASATVSATVAFWRKGMIEWRSGMPIALMAMLGGSAGALSVSILPRSALEAVVPLLLISVAIYFLLAPKLSDNESRAKISPFLYSLTIAPTIGFYDGVFGPGVGSFFMVSFVLLLGQGILRAMSFTKLANASSNIGALIVFAWKGAIILPVALSMAAGAFLGAQLGARCAVRFGSRLIKPILIAICCLMAGKLLLNPDNPLRHALMHWS
ncbi:TSUP family transporter [Herbaspirillum sp. RTI4]|uniref:TSUP family transporter n=1 Tax=Herbaspirillum sp. RTI4 TaxID=3048640 RepID=UPI002AB53E21|nr:TSUP family transporter [Herbaspirillum sp. RTI4]MDY7577523.1 TSUP family transporter [Herbaspirillum sp. RTI4]MEA9980998.1 TSUP family transporter [Herbaspirillum sp. RTI4]